MLDISPRSKTKPAKTSSAQWNTSDTGLNYVSLFAERINTVDNVDTFVPGGKTFGLQTNAAKKNPHVYRHALLPEYRIKP